MPKQEEIRVKQLTPAEIELLFEAALDMLRVIIGLSPEDS